MTTIAPLTFDNWPDDAIPERWVESLFEKMLFTYGAKFSDQWKGIDPHGLKRQWAIELGKFTREELKTGFDKLNTCDWPPTLPQFQKLCRPAIDPTVAYYEAVNGCAARDRGEVGEWSSPAVYWAMIRVGAFDLKNMSYSQIKVRWEKALQDEIAKGAWSDIPMPLIALPGAGKAALSRDVAARVFHDLKAEGVLKSVDEPIDHKSWARKILQRAAEGDKKVSLIQIQCAKEALNNGEKNG